VRGRHKFSTPSTAEEIVWSTAVTMGTEDEKAVTGSGSGSGSAAGSESGANAASRKGNSAEGKDTH
jgi:hypothetical protein